MDKLVRGLGTESVKEFKDRFDEICGHYQSKAIKKKVTTEIYSSKKNMVRWLYL